MESGSSDNSASDSDGQEHEPYRDNAEQGEEQEHGVEMQHITISAAHALPATSDADMWLGHGGGGEEEDGGIDNMHHADNAGLLQPGTPPRRGTSKTAVATLVCSAIVFVAVLIAGVTVAIVAVNKRQRPHLPHTPDVLPVKPPMNMAFVNFTQTQHWFDQRLDHTAVKGSVPFTTKWRQRYFQITDFWKYPTGPVILNVCGEYTCKGLSESRLFPAQIAMERHALVLSLEHRFYGESQPFGAAQGALSTANLKLLSVQQGLRDLACNNHSPTTSTSATTFPSTSLTSILGNTLAAADFIGEMQKWIDSQPGAPASGVATKWLVVGGSYPGAMAAWMRAQYPDLISGAVASSAVVHAKIQFEAYDRQVGQSVQPHCAAALRATTAQVEADIPAVRAALGLPAPHFTDEDVLYLTGDAAASAVQYGHIQALCGALQPQAGNPAPALRLAFQEFTQQFFFGTMGAAPADYNRTLLAQPHGSGGTMRAWWWQQCSELGWFQVAATPASAAVRSERVDLAYFMGVCNHLFGISTPPNVGAINSAFGFEVDDDGKLQSTNVGSIVFTNGVKDPWQWAAVRHIAPTVPAGVYGTTARIIDCPSCAHAVTLHTPRPDEDAPSLVGAREFILKATKAWLASV